MTSYRASRRRGSGDAGGVTRTLGWIAVLTACAVGVTDYALVQGFHVHLGEHPTVHDHVHWGPHGHSHHGLHDRHGPEPHERPAVEAPEAGEHVLERSAALRAPEDCAPRLATAPVVGPAPLPLPPAVLRARPLAPDRPRGPPSSSARSASS